MTLALPGDIARMEYWILAVVGTAAAVEDLARRTISNWLCLAALAGGIVCQLAANGWIGIGTALLGAVCGFGIFLVFYLLGGMGGGDVKLMAGFGAMLGASRLLEAAFWTALVGGLGAVIVLAIAAVRSMRARPGEPNGKVKAIPYAPAIVIGVFLTLLSAK